MTPVGAGGRWWRTSIRTRLAVILSLVLAPVLVLSVIQAALTFRREVAIEQAELVGAVAWSAAAVGDRIASGEILLRTLIPAASGPSCASRLTDTAQRIAGYINFIRFDVDGTVLCAAAGAPADAARAERPWFQAMVDGAASSVTSEPGVAYAREPAILVSVRVEDEQGRMTGVLSGVVTLASLRPAKDGRSVPVGSEVALVDGAGRYLSSSNPDAFPAIPLATLAANSWSSAVAWTGTDRGGHDRLYTAAPLAAEDIHVLLSTPKRDVVAWAWLNPLSAIGLPLLAFVLALVGVWVVADREVVRWIAYLQRIAAIYARGRYRVHPARAAYAPPEIRDLAQSMDAMAATIAARDRSARENLVQKDGLLREIHHRVKNNLQVISSLLNMQQRALVDPAARAAISDTRQRIAALALIYRALYEGPDLHKVDLQAFLEELIAQLMVSETGKRATIRTQLAIDTVSINPDRLAPLALFAVEAISNAKKHGLADDVGVLGVAFHVCDGVAELVINDSGAGGSEPGAVGAGVGRTLMVAFARQLNGEANFEARPGGGLAARLRFPAPEAVPSH